MAVKGGPRSKLGEASKELRAFNERTSLSDLREREASAAPKRRCGTVTLCGSLMATPSWATAGRRRASA